MIRCFVGDPMPFVIVALVIFLAGLKWGRREQRRERGMPR